MLRRPRCADAGDRERPADARDRTRHGSRGLASRRRQLCSVHAAERRDDRSRSRRLRRRSAVPDADIGASTASCPARACVPLDAMEPDPRRTACPIRAAARPTRRSTFRSGAHCWAACSTARASRSTARARSSPSATSRCTTGRSIRSSARRSRKVLDVGVRAINALTTVGRGQRMGLFAGSGVGKSVLLGMMARYTAADVIVVGLIGERGREVKEFIENILGPQGRARSVVVAAPADVSPLLRLQGAAYATAIAEYFRDQGKHVLLIMDSLTRYAMAQREIALAIGEPPVTKGYPPSVFAQTSAARRARRQRQGRRRLDHGFLHRARRRRRSAGSRWATPRARSWTATSCSRARSPIRATIRRSTSRAR